MSAVPAYFVSAPWRSSGKTIVTLGLSATAHKAGLATQTFKKGPDFIDPLWLTAASGRPCYNLDTYQQSTTEIHSLYMLHSHAADLSLVEGTMGLHDGLNVDGSDSNAAIAKLLQIPVLLVVDCNGMHRTVAALVNGITQFDSQLTFAGLILNRVKTPRHAQKVINAVNAYTDISVLGEIPESNALTISEKNLGLVPAPDHPDCSAIINAAGALFSENCDVESLLKPAINNSNNRPAIGDFSASAKNKTHRIAIAKDAAFHFYYQDDLDYLESAGAEIVEVSPLTDKLPDNIDGLIIGGGFPERHAKQLASNTDFLQALCNAIRNGLTVHAECAGLMYLCKSITTTDGNTWPMTGVIDGHVNMREKPVGRGYMRLETLHAPSDECWAHEFHHSEIRLDSAPDFVYRVTRGCGVDGEHDGIRVYNVIASYAHFRHTRATPWIDHFLSRVETQSDQSVCSK